MIPISHGYRELKTGFPVQGALMFIVYGDPKSSNPPIFSVRTTSGYTQPELLTSSNSVSVRLISSTWQRPSQNSTSHSPSTYIASVSFACSRCWEWTGSEIDPISPDQSWIWAWNEDQVFTEFRDDAFLEPHLHGDGEGGTGRLTVDMRTRPEEQIGELAPEIENTKTGWIPRAWMWNLHGLVLGFAFLVLFPAGTLAIRLEYRKAFTLHWVLQLTATILVTAGTVTGLFLHKKLENTHQKLGLLILIIVWTQAFLGWRHHANFLKFFRRTWISLVHVWLGKVLLFGGCANILIGMSLRGRSRLSIEGWFLLEVFELVAVGYWVLLDRAPRILRHDAARFEGLRGQEMVVDNEFEKSNDGESTSSQG